MLPDCGWPGCEHGGKVSTDGGVTAWCWCHVEVTVEAVNVARLGTCAGCGQSTVHEVDGVPLHPPCARRYALLRASQAR